MLVIARTLLVLQCGLIALLVYAIVDAYMTPYQSEWLTAGAFVPFYVLFILFFGLCMFLTWRVMRGVHKNAGLWLSPLALFTVIPYVGLISSLLRPS